MIGSDMRTISRIIAGVLGVLVGGLGIYILSWEIIHRYLDSTAWPAALVTVALLAVWFALRGHQELERIVHSLLCGGITAIVGLGVGVIGAIYFYPENNLAPLMSVILTAPAGFVLGCIGGFIWHMATRKSLIKL
jgi:hypothetical protein